MDLGLVEIEWADGEEGRVRRTTLESASDVAFESAAPVRGFSSYRGQRHFPGWYWAATTRSLVGFESWLERDRAMLLDHDRQVVGLSSQPFRLTWPGDLARDSHTPDYFARLEDGSGLVVDVRLADRVGPEDTAKFSSTEAMCQELGCWSYVLVHEPDPVVMANIRWLAGYRHPRHGVAGVWDLLLSVFSQPVPLLAGAQAAGDPIVVLPTLFHLLWCGELCVELEVPLSDGSVVCPMEVACG